MSGALGILASLGGVRELNSVTVAANGGGAFGFASTFGSVNPTTYQGHAIQEFLSSSFLDFTLRVSGALAETTLQGIFVTDGTSAIRWYARQAGTYSLVGGVDARWSWGDGSNKAWTAAHGARSVWIVTS